MPSGGNKPKDFKSQRPSYPVDMGALDKFRNIDRVKKDSLLLNPRPSGRKRALRLFLSLAALCALAIAGGLAWNAFSEWRDKSARLASIKERIESLDSALPRLSGLERERAALKAISLCDDAATLEKDPLWSKRTEGFKKLIAAAGPVLNAQKGAPYIVQTALIEMAYIPQGRFFMGRRSYEQGGDEELPRHAVSFPYEFWIAACETTNAQMRRIYPNFRTPSWRRVSLNGPSQPAAGVDWFAAMDFCKALTKAEAAAGRLPPNYEYRLPTEAEWEYAARAGTETYYFWSDKFPELGASFANTLDAEAADYFGWKRERNMVASDGFLPSAPVASYKPNAFGLYDVSGNVWEWTLDWYNPQAYRSLPESAPFQAEPVKVKLTKSNAFGGKVWVVDAYCKAIRGGAWGTAPEFCRSAARDFVPPSYRNIDIGFRVALGPVLNPLPEPKPQTPDNKGVKK